MRITFSDVYTNTSLAMASTPGFASTGISLRPVPANLHCIEFGPNGFIAIAAENIVSIYQYRDSKLTLFRVLPHHRAFITCVKWAKPSVEVMKSGSFHQFLAVSDDRGNCIVYDVLNGVRHAGISPEREPGFAIVSIEWGQKLTLFVLTSLPSLVCIDLCHRRSSNVESWSGSGLPFASFNMKPVFGVTLPCQFSFINVDPFSPSVLVLVSTDGNAIIVRTDRANGKAVMSSVFQLLCDQEVVKVQFYPHAPNYIVVSHEFTMALFNLATKEQNVIFGSDVDRLAPLDGVFMPDSPGSYWVVLRDGTMFRYGLEPDGWIRKSMTSISAVRLRMAACDPYHTGRIATLDKNGNLTVFQERKDKVFAVAHVPWFPETIAAWTCNEEYLVFATNVGYVGVIDHSGKCVRFSLDAGEMCPSIAFCDTKKQIIVGGNNRIHYIDILKRQIITKKVNFTPQRICATGDIVAFSPLPNVLNIIGGDFHRTFVFDNPIRSFTYDRQSKMKWAVLYERGGGSILDLASKTKRKFTFKENDEFMSDVACSNDQIFVVTTRGEFYILNSETKLCKTVKIGDTPLKSISVFNELALIIDESERAILVDTTTTTIVGYSRSKVSSANFVSESCAAVQTSDTSIKYVALPTFEPVPTEKTHQKRLLLSRFARCQTVADFHRVGEEMGDLEFLQLIATLTGKSNMMLSCSYILPQKYYMQKERCTRSLDRRDEKHIIEFDIISGNLREAANLLLKHSDSKASMLWAHCCMSPSLEAARELAKVAGKHYKMVALLLIAAGDPDEAIRLLIDNEDWAYAIRFSKLLFDDSKAATVISKWIKERPRVQRPELVFTSIHDHHAALAGLLKNKSVSRAVVYLRYLEENNIRIEPSQFQEILELPCVDEVIANVKSVWDHFKEQLSISE